MNRSWSVALRGGRIGPSLPALARVGRRVGPMVDDVERFAQGIEDRSKSFAGGSTSAEEGPSG